MAVKQSDSKGNPVIGKSGKQLVSSEFIIAANSRLYSVQKLQPALADGWKEFEAITSTAQARNLLVRLGSGKTIPILPLICLDVTQPQNTKPFIAVATSAGMPFGDKFWQELNVVVYTDLEQAKGESGVKVGSVHISQKHAF